MLSAGGDGAKGDNHGKPGGGWASCGLQGPTDTARCKILMGHDLNTEIDYIMLASAMQILLIEFVIGSCVQ